MRYVIGLDVGTTCVKALLFDETGNIVSSAKYDDELFTPCQGWAEQDAEHWTKLSAKVIQSIITGSAVDPGAVAALAISSQGLTIVPVDGSFKPLRNAINWLDQRSTEETDYIRSLKSDEEIYAVTGKSIMPGYSLTNILWIKRNEPEIYSRAAKLLLPHDYLCARFTGNPVTDHTLAGGTMLYDIPGQCWSEELLEIYDIDRDLLPELKWSGMLAGSITTEASRLLGLPEGTPVITGGQDQKVAAYGACLKPGLATISLGTCAAMEFYFDSPPTHPERGLAAFSYMKPGAWLLEACVPTAGAAVKWAGDTLFPVLDFDGIESLAGSCKTSGGVFFYPHLQGSGTPYNVSSRGTFTGLSLSTTQTELARSVYEGIAMEVHLNLLSAEEAGIDVREMCVFGGASNSRLLCQMLADVTGRAIRAFDMPEMGAFGAAKLAAEAAGIESFAMPSGRWFEPDASKKTIYDELYFAYTENLGLVMELYQRK